MTQVFKLVPNPAAPRYAPLAGWRLWLSKYLPVPRTRVLWQTQDGYLVCHPDNVAVARKRLDAAGYRYEVQPVALAAVPNPPSEGQV